MTNPDAENVKTKGVEGVSRKRLDAAEKVKYRGVGGSSILRLLLWLTLMSCSPPPQRGNLKETKKLNKKTDISGIGLRGSNNSGHKVAKGQNETIKYDKVFCGAKILIQDRAGSVYELKRNASKKLLTNGMFVERKDFFGAKVLSHNKSRICYLDSNRALFCIINDQHVRMDKGEVVDVKVDTMGYVYYLSSDGKLFFLWIKETFPFEIEMAPYRFQMRAEEKFVKIGGRCAVKENNNVLCWMHGVKNKLKTYKNDKVIERIWGDEAGSCFETDEKKIYCMSRILYGQARNPDRLYDTFREQKTRKYKQRVISLNFIEILLDQQGDLWLGGNELPQQAEPVLEKSERLGNMYKANLPFKVKTICDDTDALVINGITEENAFFCIAGPCGSGLVIDENNTCKCLFSDIQCGCP